MPRPFCSPRGQLEYGLQPDHRELTPEQISLLNELIQSAGRYTVKGIEVVVAKASSPRYVGDFAVLVHKLKDMENINVLFALAQMEDRYTWWRAAGWKSQCGRDRGCLWGRRACHGRLRHDQDLNLIQAEEKLLNFLEGKSIP